MSFLENHQKLILINQGNLLTPISLVCSNFKKLGIILHGTGALFFRTGMFDQRFFFSLATSFEAGFSASGQP